MYKNLVLVLLSCFTFVYSQSYSMNDDDDLVSRIVYGTPASIKDHPYFTGLHGGCGAAILSNTWLITAAHCVVNTASGIAYVGGERIDNSIPLWYDAVVMHPNYNHNNGHSNDIALLHLQMPLTFTDRIQPIKLPKTLESQNCPLLLLGRGTNEYNTLSQTLMKLTLEELTPNDCAKYSNDINYQFSIKTAAADKRLICTKRAGEVGPSACFGDSGSPLVQNDTIVGVTSFIIKKDQQTCKDVILTFFTRVSHYLPWIYGITGLH